VVAASAEGVGGKANPKRSRSSKQRIGIERDFVGARACGHSPRGQCASAPSSRKSPLAAAAASPTAANAPRKRIALHRFVRFASLKQPPESLLGGSPQQKWPW